MAFVGIGRRGGGDVSPIEGREDASELITGSPDPVTDRGSGLKLSSPSLAVLAPPFPSLAVQVPSPPFLSARMPPVGSPFW